MNKKKNKFVKVERSDIHRHGVFAKTDIQKGTRIMEYIGIKLTKEAGDMILGHTSEQHQKDPENHAATYIFELDDEWDLDGDIPDNDTKYVNHSCDPNCEVNIIDGRIWVDTIKDIKKNEEITYNYGHELNEKDIYDFKKHPCKCGSERCVGYMLDEAEWPRMKELLKKEKDSKSKS